MSAAQKSAASAANNNGGSSSSSGRPSGTISAPVKLDSQTTEQQVGPYVFIKTLGKGTFGKVKLAEHCQTKLQVSPLGAVTLI